jgi:hypothetical protein
MNHLHALLVVTSGLWFAACSGGTPGITANPEVIEFAEYLRVADIEGRVESLSASDADSAAGFRMAPGSRLTLHFALPDDPALVGEWRSNALAGDEVAGRVRVVVAVDGDSPPLAIEATSARAAADDPLRFREDLSVFSGEMARLQVFCEGKRGCRR